MAQRRVTVACNCVLKRMRLQYELQHCVLDKVVFLRSWCVLTDDVLRRSQAVKVRSLKMFAHILLLLQNEVSAIQYKQDSCMLHVITLYNKDWE